jgi:hypothetical protein
LRSNAGCAIANAIITRHPAATVVRLDMQLALAA